MNISLADSPRRLTQAERSERIRNGMAWARYNGKQLGNPRLAEFRCSDVSRANQVRSAKAAAWKAKLICVIEEFQRQATEPLTLRHMAEKLNSAGYRTPRSKQFSAMQVLRIKQWAASDPIGSDK